MRLIGVVDLAGGQAVHARSGERRLYRAVESVDGRDVRGHPIRLARAYVERFGLAELYAADLDAIEAACSETSSSPLGTALPSRDANQAAIAELAEVAPLWVDAAISTADQARRALDLGIAQVVVGLETLRSLDELSAICDVAGRKRVAFSLDLRSGAPVAPRLEGLAPPLAHLAARASALGAGSLIVLDLDRVGTGAGPDLSLLEQLRAAAPAVTLVWGGGVGGVDDLARLADGGCDGALIATALHSGRLSPADVRRTTARGGSTRGSSLLEEGPQRLPQR